MAQWLVTEEPEHYGYDQLEGDRTFYYHTGKEKSVVAVALAEIKADDSFASFPLVRMSRLSVMPVTDAEWTRIEKMSTS